ncbi:RimK family protein [Shewanella sp. NIFS-20-20]|uniref:RimK family protein n=1 Tax=Shewanella sp. NIFS-20-20 TaxID=2853806 RepID=UPI001C47D64E|nr:RimK family protein [Shewanella sp. NIFS-20-20]MBV7316295.1 RimK family protein [Shewanella sp. NIFS-20-20]
MANIIVVIDDDRQWQDYFHSDQVMTVEQYLESGASLQHKATSVLNLCRSYQYMSNGYYCSLLAEARGHRIMPRVMTINDLTQPMLMTFRQQELDKHFSAHTEIIAKIFFGKTQLPGFEKVARQLFEKFMVPVLDVRLTKVDGRWQLNRLNSFSFQDLNDAEQTFFAESLEQFSNKVWRSKSQSRKYRYDVAVLVDSEEKFPPSDQQAIKRFIKAANRLGMSMEIIGPQDISRLGEFDGLFIRATTNIGNFTYRFAKAAENLGLVVMDDPESIMKCTNKVFLTELLNQHKVPMPLSAIIRAKSPSSIAHAEQTIGFPMVLKIPDGAFSVGVTKVKTSEELYQQCQRIGEQSALILAQEFLPTDFDWRVGILNRQPIFVCRYFMSRGHWQIYQHHQSGKVSSGNFDCVDIKQAPKPVIDAALKAANLIGSGLYGVDVKERDGKAYVIEVNDNPSIDNKVEDLFLGDLLYDRVITEFLRRIQLRGL